MARRARAALTADELHAAAVTAADKIRIIFLACSLRGQRAVDLDMHIDLADDELQKLSLQLAEEFCYVFDVLVSECCEP